MSKKMLIDATHAEETRVVVVDGTKVEEFDFETLNKRQLAGNIYLAKVTRVEPSLQAAFVEYGGNRHGFLAFAEIHPDYYQIPMADRKALLEEERALNRDRDEDEDDERANRRRRRRKPRAEAAGAAKGDVTTRTDVAPADIKGMEVVDLDAEEPDAAEMVQAAADISDMPVVDAQMVADLEAPSAQMAPDGILADTPADVATDSVSGASDDASAADDSEEPYRAMDYAADHDDEIESVAEEDIADEISEPRRPRLRKYKIQEVVKVRQIMLVQVVKEERGNKGAALTTYLSLAGRYCVLMPNTARGGGISRKITQAADRKKLKEIAAELEVPEGAGLIIRTAGSNRTKPEIKRDYEYLMRLWEQVRDLTLRSVAPAPIYEEGDLIKRSIRDLYNRDIEEVLVEGAEGYRVAKDFMKMIMPSHAKNVQLYNEPQPLFARHQVETYLSGMFNPTVQLKSGGYIVIGVTEALVAIDVNSGRATKEGSIEETALKTNIEAAEEIARQLRLRDLAGLIVIDFIDMEERRNNAAVEKRLKDKLKTDRARIQVGRISGFGLLEMSRQRLRPGVLESTTQPCAHCHGTGLIRSDDSLALQILRALEEEGVRKRTREVVLKAPTGIVNFLFNYKREHIISIEARYGMSVRIEADPSLISPDYSIEKLKTATRVVSPASPVVSLDASVMAEIDAASDDEDPDDIADVADADTEAQAGGDGAGTGNGAGNGDGDEGGEGGRKRRRRRSRRRRSGGAQAEGSDAGADGSADADADADAESGSRSAPEGTADGPSPAAPEEPEQEPAKPKRRTRSRKKAPAPDAAPDAAVVEGPEAEAPAAVQTEAAVTGADVAEAEAEAEAGPVAEKPAPKPRRSRARKKAPEADAAQPTMADAPVAEPAPDAVAEPAPQEVAAPEVQATPEPQAVPETVPETVPEAVPDAVPDPVTPGARAEANPAAEAPASDAAPKSRRSGWWSLRR